MNRRPLWATVHGVAKSQTQLNDQLYYTTHKHKSYGTIFSNYIKAPFVLGFPGGSAVKGSAVNSGDAGWEDTPEKEVATQSCILAWEIPWTKEIGELWSVGS